MNFVGKALIININSSLNDLKLNKGANKHEW